MTAPSGAFAANKELSELELRERRTVLESKPVFLSLIVTDWCNLECVMCPQVRRKRGFTLPPAFFSELEGLLPYLEAVEWQGGEFFRMEHVGRFFRSLGRYPRIAHSIITNGLLLDDSWMELLLGMKATLQFSIDSPRKETYERIRRGADLGALVERLRRLAELERASGRRTPRDLLAVVMRSNYRHLAELFDFAREHGFRSLALSRVRFLEGEEDVFAHPPEDLSSTLEEARRLLSSRCEEHGMWLQWNLSAPEGGRGGGDEDPRLGCRFPWQGMVVDAARGGDILPDCWCERSVGNAREVPLLEAWNSEGMREYRRRLAAGDFSLCAGCAGRSFPS